MMDMFLELFLFLMRNFFCIYVHRGIIQLMDIYVFSLSPQFKIPDNLSEIHPDKCSKQLLSPELYQIYICPSCLIYYNY